MNKLISFNQRGAFGKRAGLRGQGDPAGWGKGRWVVREAAGGSSDWSPSGLGPVTFFPLSLSTCKSGSAILIPLVVGGSSKV